MFPTKIQDILQCIQQVDPVQYARSRNFSDGAVTYLGPYLSRGVISTKQVFDHLTSLNLPWQHIEKLVQELAWRDYWQNIWVAKGEAINKDLKHPQQPLSNHKISTSIVEHNTGIHAIDSAIKDLYKKGYMHNHMRMYVACVACNIAQSHWLTPARWMYYHLLDGDWASNALSWQWVAGCNASRKYYANQDNINKYFKSSQKQTFLDIEYGEFNTLATPEALLEFSDFIPLTNLTDTPDVQLERDKKTLVYNYYNLDPDWWADEEVQRVLLLEPSFFKTYPVSQKCIEFVLQLADNIAGIKIMVADFEILAQKIDPAHIIYKEHPTNQHYHGQQESRSWMFPVSGEYSSFFAFWKKCKKLIPAQGL
jgi:deoxyribodipyrimidine photo-lyase